MRHSKAWWFLVVTGLLILAVTPFVIVDQVLQAHVENQARARLEALAASTLGLVETRLDQVITTLVDLAAANINSCNFIAFSAMRRAVFTSISLKELSIIDKQGRTLCTHIGVAPEERALSREITLSNHQLTIAMARFRDRNEKAVQLRLDRVGNVSLAALIPAENLLPEASTEEANSSRRLRLMLDGGDTIASRPGGEEDGGFDEGYLKVRRYSERFPIMVDAERSLSTIGDEYWDILMIGRLGAILVTALGLAFVGLTIRRNRNDLVAELKRAIANGEIIPFYQPLVDIKTGKMHGCEVLARWRKPDGTIVPPVRFIPLAEQSGLIYDMTRALMRCARDEMNEVYSCRPNIKLGFNLFAGHFSDAKVVDDVRKIFEDSAIAFNQIVLEVTERSTLPDLGEARRIISQLQELGAHVGIDDVGTGHGGLSYLLKLGVDLIKIDKMFVDALGTERYSQTIIETLVELAHNMKMEVIAEGVETIEQVEYLRAKGITIAQGYVFAPPLLGSSYVALLEAMEKPHPKVVPLPRRRPNKTG